VLRLTPLTARRDFLDVRDVADAVRLAATAPVTGRVINVGSGQLIHVRDLVDLLVAASGATARLVEEAAPGTAAARAAGIEYQHLDVRAAHRLLGWVARRRLADAARALWASTLTPR
jgi:nucleoside-diphosphate-sugar epimerase